MESNKKYDKSQNSQAPICHDKAPQNATPIACHQTDFQKSYERDCHDCFLMKHPPFLLELLNLKLHLPCILE